MLYSFRNGSLAWHGWRRSAWDGICETVLEPQHTSVQASSVIVLKTLFRLIQHPFIIYLYSCLFTFAYPYLTHLFKLVSNFSPICLMLLVTAIYCLVLQTTWKTNFYYYNILLYVRISLLEEKTMSENNIMNLITFHSDNFRIFSVQLLRYFRSKYFICF